jgi:Domain of unknown function (DUF6089)
MSMSCYLKLKYLLILFIIVGTTINVKAQKYEVGVMAGESYYYGDIINDLQLKTISYSGGIFVRQHINENLAIKYFGGTCHINGADSLSTSAYQRHRNLSFWADVYEVSAQVEYSFVKDITRGRFVRNRFIPYAFVGLGAFYFMNYAYDPSKAVTKLWQLGTSGTIYNNYAFCIPFGAGIRFKITSKVCIGLEIGVRYTSTSWLDDVGGPTSFYAPKSQLQYEASKVMSDRSIDQAYLYSGKQRGKISTEDVYVMGGLTLSYRLGSFGGASGYRGHAIRCPRFY